MTDKRQLPHPEDVIEARAWLLAGCPAYPAKDAFGERRDVKKCIDTLVELMEALPSHLPVYAFGSPENMEARAKGKR